MGFNKLIAVLPFVAGALSKPLEARAATSNFTIYAYGSDGINGFPLISINDTAYFSSTPIDQLTNAQFVTFDSLSTRGNFTANVDGEGQSLFYVPSTSGPVGYTNTTDDDSVITTGFGFYGHVIYLLSDSSMLTEWYAIPTNNSDIWQLGWNEEDTGVPVALRNIAPTF